MSAAVSSPAAPPLLKVRDLEKTFPGVRALYDVSFSVTRGEVHALLGENGAGKSTLIKIVSGVFPPNRGRILIDGAGSRKCQAYAAKCHPKLKWLEIVEAQEEQRPVVQPGDDADQQIWRQAVGPVRHDLGRDAERDEVLH